MAAPDRPITPAEYLARERAADTRSEYHAGHVYALAGAGRNHVRITVNLVLAVQGRLRGGPCEAFTGDLRVRVSETGLYTYPDLSVVCGGPRFEDAQADVLLNPTLVVEVLSPTTQGYDRGTKFGHYRRLPTLREYVLVVQDAPHVERFTRDADAWVLSEARGLDAVLELPSIGCALPLAELYERVEFPPEPRLRAVHERPAADPAAAAVPG